MHKLPMQIRKEGRIIKKLNRLLVFMIAVSVIAPGFMAEVAGQQSESDKIEFLIKNVKDPSWQVRWDAAAALGETKDRAESLGIP